MVDSESIKEIVNQAAMEAAAVVMMAFMDAEIGLLIVAMQNQLETQGQRNGGLVLQKPQFN